MLEAVGVELLHSTGPRLIRPKTGGSDKGSSNTTFVFSLKLFSGSQMNSLKQEVSFINRAVASVQMHRSGQRQPPASDEQKRS